VLLLKKPKNQIKTRNYWSKGEKIYDFYYHIKYNQW